MPLLDETISDVKASFSRSFSQASMSFISSALMDEIGVLITLGPCENALGSMMDYQPFDKDQHDLNSTKFQF